MVFPTDVHSVLGEVNWLLPILSQFHQLPKCRPRVGLFRLLGLVAWSCFNGFVEGKIVQKKKNTMVFTPEKGGDRGGFQHWNNESRQTHSLTMIRPRELTCHVCLEYEFTKPKGNSVPSQRAEMKPFRAPLYICPYVYLYIYIYVYVYTNMYMDLYILIYIYIYVYL